jgi:hypothetical protein
MMATTAAPSSTISNAMPVWMASAESAIADSPAWQVLLEELFTKLQVRLEKQQLGQFSDLREQEQIALIDELQRSMVAESDTTYKAFEWQLGRVLDEHIAGEAHRRLYDAHGRPVCKYYYQYNCHHFQLLLLFNPVP